MRKLYKYLYKIAILDDNSLVGSLIDNYFIKGYLEAKYFNKVKKYLLLTTL